MAMSPPSTRRRAGRSIAPMCWPRPAWMPTPAMSPSRATATGWSCIMAVTIPRMGTGWCVTGSRTWRRTMRAPTRRRTMRRAKGDYLPPARRGYGAQGPGRLRDLVDGRKPSVAMAGKRQPDARSSVTERKQLAQELPKIGGDAAAGANPARSYGMPGRGTRSSPRPMQPARAHPSTA